MIGAHHKVLALRRCIFHLNPADRPAELRGNDVAALDNRLRALPQRLDPVHLRIDDLHMVRIPERRAAQLRHLRIRNPKAMVMPERVPQIKKTVIHTDIAAFLERALPVRRPVEPAVLHLDIPAAVQRTLHVKCLILYCLQSIRLLLICVHMVFHMTLYSPDRKTANTSSVCSIIPEMNTRSAALWPALLHHSSAGSVQRRSDIAPKSTSSRPSQIRTGTRSLNVYMVISGAYSPSNI